MPRSKRSQGEADDGSASLEFITAGFLLLVPLVYLILVMAAIQGGALAVEGAARQASRVYVQAKTKSSGASEARMAVDFALSDFGLGHASTKLTIRCRPHPTKCLTRDNYVTVTVRASVPLPLVPNVLSLHTPFAIPMTATSTEQVSRFWGAQ